MEDILPRDITNLILGELSNYELFQYGITCKRSLASAEIIWTKRHQTTVPKLKLIIQLSSLESNFLENIKFEAIPMISSYQKYTYSIYQVVLGGLKTIFSDFENQKIIEKKFEKMELLLNIVKDSYPIIESYGKFKKFLRAVERRLHDFVYGSRYEREIAHKYYPILFPLKYPIILAELEEEEMEQENNTFMDEVEYISRLNEMD
jgi:hypothetical protein